MKNPSHRVLREIVELKRYLFSLGFGAFLSLFPLIYSSMKLGENKTEMNLGPYVGSLIIFLWILSFAAYWVFSIAWVFFFFSYRRLWRFEKRLRNDDLREMPTGLWVMLWTLPPR